MRPLLSELSGLSDSRPIDPLRAADPVAAVLAAHADGRVLGLTTSGSTGAPRTVRRTTESWWSSFPAYSALSHVDLGARVFVPGPVSATMNLFAAVHATWTGADVTRSPERATHACLTPTALLRHAGALRPGTRVVLAGDRLSPASLAAAADRGLGVAHYYGAAELSFVAAAEADGPLAAFPGVEVDLRSGEIWVRSPYVCAGVEGDQGTFRRDGEWATVGDLGQLHASALTVLGRPGHVVTAGATVALAQVEAALRPSARGDLAVLGVPHPGVGAVVVAVVTDETDLVRLRARARAVLPATHRPRRWVHLDALPLTDAAKVDRRALADRLGARLGGLDG